MGELLNKYLIALLLATAVSACATPNYTAQEVWAKYQSYGQHKAYATASNGAVATSKNAFKPEIAIERALKLCVRFGGLDCHVTNLNGEPYPPKPQNGQGAFTYHNGDKYDGDWLDGKRHGRGILTYASGSEYIGEWMYDKRHGRGIIHAINSQTYFTILITFSIESLMKKLHHFAYLRERQREIYIYR